MRRVLVVDDHPESVFIVRRMLQHRGYAVLVATGGEEALETITRERPDVILLDVMMPGMTGLEVLRRLRDEPGTQRLPVILVTARAEDEDLMYGYQSGADYYLPKPFTAEQLVYGIELVLEPEDTPA